MPRTMDFNLLRALQALLEERSVTRAAERLGQSQPAASAALAKLRRHYRDELLTRVGNSYQLSPLALQLLEHAAEAVAMAERAFSLQADFDPAASERTFTVAVSDYTATVLGPALSRLLSDRAPGIQLHLRTLTADMLEGAPETLRGLDAVVMPHSYLVGLPYEDLLHDEWVCLVSTDNQAVGEELSKKHLADLPWAYTFRRLSALTTAIRELRVHGIEPHPRMIAESYSALPSLVAGTNHIALIQKRLTRLAPRMDQVRVMQCPVPLAPLVLALWWHPTHTADAGHQWLRGLFHDAEALALSESVSS
ncbi:LysR family transcriptional regulator [Streptomyces himalayensis]|uniref:LysR family transcriptional regulator n=1 Tax=Streptomyces himalayensis subsp. himalayensis TaxID=2756131 RepID=A0A7W0DKM1_9ACTN|nr:LysR family transcriptional regulator [Streptomyces himalayensis]MBA2946837.1 LysR family transcriptional regulator [Streptomyces himalayensis subsp. himalayensis]